MIKLIIRYGPALIVFLTILLSAVVTTVSVPKLMVPLLVVAGVALLARFVFGPLR